VNSKKKTTVAIYVPLSPSQPEDVQASELHSYALRKGWELIEYREKSSRTINRPVFKKLMADAKRHQFDLVLVPTLDCFADSLADLARNVTRLDLLGIRLHTAGESIDTDRTTHAGRSFLDALTLMAKTERKMIVRRVRAGLAKAQSRGVRLGRPPVPFVENDEARNLRKQGLSFRAIAARMDTNLTTVFRALRRRDTVA
jgi:DNA invertase Pin-like site-specific DNA recombinase